MSGRPALTQAEHAREAPLVQAAGMTLGYGGAPVLDNVSFALGGGMRAAVLGPNGGGKTTLFRAVLGEI